MPFHLSKIIREQLREDDSSGVSAALVEATSATQAALSAMAKAQAQARPPTVSVDDLLASALGQVAMITTPPPLAPKQPAPTAATAAAASPDDIQHDLQRSKTTSKTVSGSSSGNSSSAALKMYQRRSEADPTSQPIEDVLVSKKAQGACGTLVVASEAQGSGQKKPEGWFA